MFGMYGAALGFRCGNRTEKTCTMLRVPGFENSGFPSVTLNMGDVQALRVVKRKVQYSAIIETVAEGIRHAERYFVAVLQAKAGVSDAEDRKKIEYMYGELLIERLGARAAEEDWDYAIEDLNLISGLSISKELFGSKRLKDLEAKVRAHKGTEGEEDTGKNREELAFQKLVVGEDSESEEEDEENEHGATESEYSTATSDSIIFVEQEVPTEPQTNSAPDYFMCYDFMLKKVDLSKSTASSPADNFAVLPVHHSTSTNHGSFFQEGDDDWTKVEEEEVVEESTSRRFAFSSPFLSLFHV